MNWYTFVLYFVLTFFCLHVVHYKQLNLFLQSIECDKKPHANNDSRPCSVHTSDLLRYNSVTTKIMLARGFQVVDSFPITSGRPDLSGDGLHFETSVTCNMKGRRTMLKDCETTVKQMYLSLNEMFLNNICSLDG